MNRVTFSRIGGKHAGARRLLVLVIIAALEIPFSETNHVLQFYTAVKAGFEQCKHMPSFDRYDPYTVIDVFIQTLIVATGNTSEKLSALLLEEIDSIEHSTGSDHTLLNFMRDMITNMGQQST